MYVFGGAKLLSEEIVNELWALDLQTQVWTPLFDHQPLNTEHNNATLMEVGGVSSSVSIEPSGENFLPLPVRSHTAHVVDSRMIVLFGVSSGAETLISYVQEYDFSKLCYCIWALVVEIVLCMNFLYEFLPEYLNGHECA